MSKGESHIKAKRIEADGHVFDSGEEHEYYQHLKSRDDVVDIQLQPEFLFMPAFHIDCGRCGGDGRVPSPKTGNMINCKTCKGTGERKRREWKYTADFKVWYKNGRVDVVDVKGFANERFSLVRKMFEYQNGYELIVINKKKGKWVRS